MSEVYIQIGWTLGGGWNSHKKTFVKYIPDTTISLFGGSFNYDYTSREYTEVTRIGDKRRLVFSSSDLKPVNDKILDLLYL